MEKIIIRKLENYILPSVFWLTVLLGVVMLVGSLFGIYSCYMEKHRDEPMWKIFEKGMFVLFGIAGVLVGLLSLF